MFKYEIIFYIMSNAKLLGKQFENKISLFKHLLDSKFNLIPLTKNPKNNSHYYLYKEYKNKIIIYTIQSGFKKYLNKFYDIKTIFRIPDEAILIIDKVTKNILNIKLIEIKSQTMSGSIETKLWAAPMLKKEYYIYFNNLNHKNIYNLKLDYILTTNNWLYSKINNKFILKYNILLKILKEYKIYIYNGDNIHYYKYIDIIIFKNL